jgi:hypothetical protein
VVRTFSQLLVRTLLSLRGRKEVLWRFSCVGLLGGDLCPLLSLRGTKEVGVVICDPASVCSSTAFAARPVCSSFEFLGYLIYLVWVQDTFDFAQAGVIQMDRNGNVKDKLLISFGPCQYPTLGLIVKRHW